MERLHLDPVGMLFFTSFQRQKVDPPFYLQVISREVHMEAVQSGKNAFRNDVFRRSGFGITLTSGVQELKGLGGLLREVRGFTAFTPENDPYGEHDFGEIMWHGEKVFWKIDYYDPKLEYFQDPLDDACIRILTVMLASEY